METSRDHQQSIHRKYKDLIESSVSLMRNNLAISKEDLKAIVMKGMSVPEDKKSLERITLLGEFDNFKRIMTEKKEENERINLENIKKGKKQSPDKNDSGNYFSEIEKVVKQISNLSTGQNTNIVYNININSNNMSNSNNSKYIDSFNTTTTTTTTNSSDNGELKKLQAEFNNLKLKVSGLEKELGSYNSEKKLVQEEINKKIAQCNYQIETEANRIKALDQKISETQKEMENFREKNKEMEAKLQSHDKKIENIEEALKKIEQKEKELNALNMINNTAFTDKINLLEKELHALRLTATLKSKNSDFDFSVPKEWSEQTDYLKLDILPKTSNEYYIVELLFKNTMSNREIKSIIRIQNTELWKNYCFAKYQLKKKGNDEEKLLFHGTSSNDPKLIYEGKEEGFDLRFALDGMWGRAIYFHLNSCFSNDFRFKTRNNTSLLFVAKVLTGNVVTLKQNKNLRHPPFIDSNKGVDRYDSVKSDFDERYMIYNNLRAYPAYLVEYA